MIEEFDENCGYTLPKAPFKMTLSKFVKKNLDIILKMKDDGMMGADLSKSISAALGVAVTAKAVSLAIARAKVATSAPAKKEASTPPVRKSKFVPKTSTLILSTQEMAIEELDKVSGNVIKKTKIMDWRGLLPNESLSSWVFFHKSQLIYLNKGYGYRWSQIADAISMHLDLNPKLSQNSLSSILCLINQGHVPIKARNN